MKITQSLIEESLALLMDCIVLSKEKRRLRSIQLIADAEAIDQRITRRDRDDFDC